MTVEIIKSDVWKGVPKSDPLKKLVEIVLDTSLDNIARQPSINGLRGAINVMKTIPARKKVCEYLESVIQKARRLNE